MQKIKLNSEQEKAVKHDSGPLLIIAGAGTGKTTVITERIIHLMQEKNVPSESLLALTFTEKAANEMLERVDIRLPLGHSEPAIKTFHAFCDQLLRQYGLEIGMSTGYEILTEIESWMFLKQHLFDLSLEYYCPVGNPTKFISILISYFAKLQDENVSPEEYIAFAKRFPAKTDEEKHEKKRHTELSKAYEQYLKLKMEQNVLEFSDMHYLVLKLFRERPNVLKRVRDQYTHILVDEFQDTNLIQFELIKLLAPNNSDLTVVADDDQSIYAFRGSNISNILNFTRHYPESEKISLTRNYRSCQEILNASYGLIQFNNPERLEEKEKISKKLSAQTDFSCEGKVVHFQQFTRNTDETEFIAEKISELIKKEDVLYSDIAILVRANSYADPVIEELNFRGIPYQFLGLKGLYQRDEIRSLLCFLRFLRNQKDDASLFHLMKLPFFGFDMEEVLLLMHEARKRKSSLWYVLKKNEKNCAQEFVKTLGSYIEKSRDSSGAVLLLGFVKEYFYPELVKNISMESERKMLNISAFFDRIKQYEGRSGGRDAVDLIDFFDLVIEAGENPATAESDLDVDAVKIMTVHGAKGLEFRYVFLPSLVSQRFPSMNRGEPIPFPDGLKKDLLPESKTNVPEERRLFYVACTRAKEQLFLTASKYYGDAKRPKKVSQFVRELGFFGELDSEQVTQSKSSGFDSGQKIKDVEDATRSAKSMREVPKRLSYSQVMTFKKCPRQYEYTYIYKIPAESTSAMSFGVSMHNTLKRFYDYLQIRDVPTLFEQGNDNSLEVLLKIYEDTFIFTDYLTKKHQKQAYEMGKKMLKEFYKKNGPNFALPFCTEKSFVVPIGNYVFSGRFDRIDKLPDGSAEVIDYKTGKKQSQKDVDTDMQLSLYALACKEALQIEPSKMTLYFLGDNEKIESSRSEKDMEKAKKIFLELAEMIAAGDFSPKPDPYVCKYCPYKNICNAALF